MLNKKVALITGIEGCIFTIRSNNRIFFDKKSSIIFLDWISKDIEIQKEYLYKWGKK